MSHRLKQLHEAIMIELVLCLASFHDRITFYNDNQININFHIK